mmetsp:Transcript_42652/g.92740  ORF Transcript_42652/g.92740 Transcript_42652/m.92740 type:complete len:119 (+) Transcript_42652:320-676(+)
MKTAIVQLPADRGPVGQVHNYNLLVVADLEEAEVMRRCRRIAKSISERGGGLDKVETMALPHEKGVEVACNLLDADITPPAKVRERVVELCQVEGVRLESDYFTNKSPEDILDLVYAS